MRALHMATACLTDPVAALQQLEQVYLHQHYHLQPGTKRPSAASVSELFGQALQSFYGGRVEEVWKHPRYKLHIVTARGRHVLQRKALGAWLERVVFSTPQAASPFAHNDYRTWQVHLSEANFQKALQASCSIPLMLLAPNPDWVKRLPNGKLPDWTDFTHYGQDLAARVTAIAASAQLADEFEA